MWFLAELGSKNLQEVGRRDKEWEKEAVGSVSTFYTIVPIPVAGNLPDTIFYLVKNKVHSSLSNSHS